MESHSMGRDPALKRRRHVILAALPREKVSSSVLWPIYTVRVLATCLGYVLRTAARGNGIGVLAFRLALELFALCTRRVFHCLAVSGPSTSLLEEVVTLPKGPVETSSMWYAR